MKNNSNSKSSAASSSSRSRLLLLSVLLFHEAAAEHAAAQALAPVTSQGNPQQQQQQQQQRQPVRLIRRSLVADSADSATSADVTTEAASADARAIPVYGNWCGPNYGSGNPVDEIDSCCRSHDLCYDRTAVYNHCSCDQQLVRCLNKIVDLKSNQLVKRAMRATIVTYFDNTACRCSMDTDMCMPVKNCICLGG